MFFFVVRRASLAPFQHRYSVSRVAMWFAMPVSIVVFGEHTTAGRLMQEKVKHMQKDYCIIDLREAFSRDKAAFRMPPYVNSTFVPYQLGLAMDREQFVETVKNVARRIATAHGSREETSPILFGIKCVDGRLDSDAVARCVADRVLNVSYDGKRLFNANVFSMDCAITETAIDSIVDQAWIWASGAWRDALNTTQWGEQAAIGNNSIAEMLTSIDEFASEFWTEVIDGKFGHQTWGNADGDDENSEANQTDLGSRLIAVLSTIGGVESRKRPQCRVCGGKTRIPDMPDIDLEYWLTILDDQTVDTEACQVWRELFEHDHRGQQEALRILNLVITNVQREVHMRSVSALVMSSVRKSWSNLGAR